ncbi:MAG: CYTH and CHAD domain-containing protein, partial [Rhodospirillales bacterium]|nr:CYTH and CHAD domain-containing protein [Rhodospirillales bacterium]
MTDSGDPIETELKLKISPDAVARLMRHSLLRRLGSGKPARKRLVSTYFDTPDLRLMHHRVALRVRKIGQRRVQTVKCAPDASGGTAARLEWEVDVGGDRPDLGAAHIERIENRNLRKLLGADKVRDRLQPLFVTDFRRTTWPLRLKGSAIELAVDVGEIKSANGRMPICEAELELKSGDRAGLYALARKLRKSIPFTVEPMSKAERGYALAAHADPRAHKAAPLRLDRAATVAETVLRIGRNCLLHLRANEAAVRAGDVTEGVHQMRVAVRRLRSALSAFRGILGKDDRRQIGGGLRWIARQCAAAREWDVFRDELLAPLRERLTADPALKLYADAVDVACADAHAKVTAMLAGKR